MSQLTVKLKNDHKNLVAALTEIKSLGVSHPEFSKELIGAKGALLAHLKHEDVDLYPLLKKAALTDSSIQGTLNVLAKDMDGIAAAAMAFFKKYEQNRDPKEFAKDFVQLSFALSTRIRREEESLYSLFDKIAEKKAA